MKCEENKISITSFIDTEESITSLKRPKVLPCGDTRGRSNQLLLDIKKTRLYSLQPKMGSSIQSAKTRLGADCSLDHELLIGKFRLKLKKVGKVDHSSMT